MTVTPATLYLPDGGADSEHFRPGMGFEGRVDDFDYVEEEWFATGEDDGRPYTTAVLVRRPRDASRFSGTVVVEPLHFFPISPIWSYTSVYIMRSGHAWACVDSQKTAVDVHVKPFNPQRYESLHIDGEPLAPEAADLDFGNLPTDQAQSPLWWEQLVCLNRASHAILAQVGAAIRASAGPFDGLDVAHIPLAGHSGTGFLLTHYIRQGHDALRLADGSPVYSGYFPSGWPTSAFGPCDVPIVEVVTQGDYASDNTTFQRPGFDGLNYRRPDSDEPADRFRLYELAGLAHTSTQYPPINDLEFLKQIQQGVQAEPGMQMSALPFNQLYQMALDHLVRWIADGVAPPRAERLVMGDDGWFVTDEHGNTVGGVRTAQLDVPRATYTANPTLPSGLPAMGSFGFEKPFDASTMKRLYTDKADYLERFNRRLDELVGEGWFLAEDAEEFRVEAQKVVDPF
jgi:hypothetical protein